MNKIFVWCPSCKEYQAIKKTPSEYWVLDDCRCFLRDAKGRKIKGQDDLAKTLKSGYWRTGDRTRRPPKAKEQLRKPPFIHND